MENMRISPAAPGAGGRNDDLLTRTAELGEYFTLTDETTGDWQEIPLLFDLATVAEYVDRTRYAISGSSGCTPQRIPLRVAASSFQLGIAARLMSPALGAATTLGMVPLLNRDSVRWQMTPNHSPRFTVTHLKWIAGTTPASSAAAISASLISDIMRPLCDTLQTVTGLSAKVMWGNVVSAANGAVTVLAMSRPQHEGRGRNLVEALMGTENLAGTGSFVDGAFVRRSCCLFYQAPGSGLCGDCILAQA